MNWRALALADRLKRAQEATLLTKREPYRFACERCHERPAVANLDKVFVCDDCHVILLRDLELELTA